MLPHGPVPVAVVRKNVGSESARVATAPDDARLATRAAMVHAPGRR
ncbi:hypothetical protein AWB66_04844 [Caballeronia telluris]|uniref:Uncharacterized protein n=1 Tax=Caballeronia telluris TaxID=326475 RepID=A0A158JXB9_9BURK|nr:hypothetical protein AWB66_04844 [Caballeronia telluris]